MTLNTAMRENLGYKLLAVLMAIAIWVRVNGERNPNVTKHVENVAAQYQGLSKSLELFDAPKRVSVNVTGPQSILRSLNASGLKVVVNLAGVEPGIQSVKANVELGEGLAGKLKAATKDIRLSIEAFKRKSFKIDVSLEGAAPLGYAFGEATADPPVAVVSGRRSLVEQVRRLNVNIGVGVARSAVEDYYPVVALDAAGNEVGGLKIEPARVSAQLELVEAPATKSVIVSPNITGSPAYPYRVISIAVSPPAITIFGRPANVIKTSTIATEQIDISNAVGSVERIVALLTPSGINSGGVRAARVTIRIGR